MKLSFKATNWYAFLSKFIASTGGGGGNNAVAISGTVTWPGHTLSANCYAYMDTIDANLNIHPVLQTQVNQTNGSFAFSFTLEGDSLNVFFDAWDDINGNGEYNVGDGWGFYDRNGSGNWDIGDALTIQPGNNYTGINISLFEITGKGETKPLKLRK